jgi:SAM-dependent methyltransferase
MNGDDTTTLRLGLDVALAPEEAFAAVVADLVAALARQGVALETGAGGRAVARGVEVGQVLAWEPGRRFALSWRAADWLPDATSEVALDVEPLGDRTRVTLEHRGWGAALGGGAEQLGWFASAVAAPALAAATPGPLGDWVTDRQARRPWGPQSRAVYADPLYHYPNFHALLAELELGPDDILLEVGCGGGAFLRQALASGCRAAAVDHSPDMVQLSRHENEEAVRSGRLDVREAPADALPFADATFTKAAMTGVLGFLPDPVLAFGEIRRTLRPGGRFVCLGSDPELRGTPAAPEPMASRLRFYADAKLAELGRRAGFTAVRVLDHDLSAAAREVGVPEEHLPLFAGTTRFLVALR